LSPTCPIVKIKQKWQAKMGASMTIFPS